MRNPKPVGFRLVVRLDSDSVLWRRRRWLRLVAITQDREFVVAWGLTPPPLRVVTTRLDMDQVSDYSLTGFWGSDRDSEYNPTGGRYYVAKLAVRLSDGRSRGFRFVIRPEEAVRSLRRVMNRNVT